MTLTIDSAPVELPPLPGETFKAYLDRIANLLIETQRCVGSCRLDGQPVPTTEEGDRLFPAASRLEVDSVSLQVALQANLALQCNAVRGIEGECEALVTDSLLSDPRQVMDSWRALCERIKGVLAFVPVLNGLLTDEQVDSLIDVRLAELNGIMTDILAVLNKADVVAFSDLLEMRLSPWLAGLREFFQAQLTLVESLEEK